MRRMKSAEGGTAQPIRLIPKLEHRKSMRPPSTGLLIDLAEPPSPPKPSVPVPVTTPSPFNLLDTLDSLAFRDSFPPSQASTTGLPPPSSDTHKWWEREVDLAWIPREGNDKNPFYVFD